MAVARMSASNNHRYITDDTAQRISPVSVCAFGDMELMTEMSVSASRTKSERTTGGASQTRIRRCFWSFTGLDTSGPDKDGVLRSSTRAEWRDTRFQSSVCRRKRMEVVEQ